MSYSESNVKENILEDYPLSQKTSSSILLTYTCWCLVINKSSVLAINTLSMVVGGVLVRFVNNSRVYIGEQLSGLKNSITQSYIACFFSWIRQSHYNRVVY